MAKAKVFVFAPADPTGESYKMLEAQSCAVKMGKASWDIRRDNGGGDGELTAGERRWSGRRSATRRSRKDHASSKTFASWPVHHGVDDVDINAATELGILVTHSPTESNWGGVAEGAITNMLTLAKGPRA
jgi:hypothetical protein